MRFSFRLALFSLFALILGSAVYFAHLSARAQQPASIWRYPQE